MDASGGNCRALPGPNMFADLWHALFHPLPLCTATACLFVPAGLQGLWTMSASWGNCRAVFFLLHVRCTSYAGPFYSFLAEALLFVVLVGLQSAFADLRSGLFQTGGPLYHLPILVGVVDLRQRAFILPTHTATTTTFRKKKRSESLRTTLCLCSYKLMPDPFCRAKRS